MKVGAWGAWKPLKSKLGTLLKALVGGAQELKVWGALKVLTPGGAGKPAAFQADRSMGKLAARPTRESSRAGCILEEGEGSGANDSG